MSTNIFFTRRFAVVAALALAALAGCSSMGGSSDTMMGTKLSGDQEVPPVATSAGGMSMITVTADGSVSGMVKTMGVTGTMAHIHLAPMGKNGPVIVPLTQSSDGVWSVPAGAKLTPEQLKSYQAGELYVNVHSAANKGGEVRAQLKP
jgi:CHRD domain